MSFDPIFLQKSNNEGIEGTIFNSDFQSAKGNRADKVDDLLSQFTLTFYKERGHRPLMDGKRELSSKKTRSGMDMFDSNSYFMLRP